MNEITLRYHLIIPSIISFLILVLIALKRKKLFAKGKWRWFWISITVFFAVYFLLVGGAAYRDITLKLELQTFDLDGNGFFTGKEITPEMEKVMKNVITDVGRNFAVITGIFFAGIISLFVFITGKLFQYIKSKIN